MAHSLKEIVDSYIPDITAVGKGPDVTWTQGSVAEIADGLLAVFPWEPDGVHSKSDVREALMERCREYRNS